MQLVRSYPQRKIVIALNWDYIYCALPARQDWRSFGIERVVTHSQQIADFVAWAMRLPTHVFTWGIRSDLYYFDRAAETPTIVFIKRKQGSMQQMLGALSSRNPDFVDRINWFELDGLSEAAYAQHIRRARVFVNMSPAEGLPCSLLEAMRAGTLVAGYNSVGGRDQLVGAGEKQNCILAENLDYPSLARQLEPLLLAILAGDTSKWDNIRQNALATAAPFTLEAEEQSVLNLWRSVLG
jgi:hypothetical protein